MTTYFVMRGKHSTPGTDICEYNFFDVIDIDTNKPINNQLRKYSYRIFRDMGAVVKNLKNDTYMYQKNISLHTGILLLSEVTVFHHTHTFLMFINAKELCKSGKLLSLSIDTINQS